MKLNTNLWHENARTQRAHRIERSNRRARALFPWLLLGAVAALWLLWAWVKS